MKKINNMKNKKIFIPTILISIAVIAVSIFSLSSKKGGEITNFNFPNKESGKNNIITFTWKQADKPVLVMTASEEVSIDAIDLYIGYKNVEIAGVNNLGELPEPAFSKVSTNNYLVVLNYLISEDDGFMMFPGQSVNVLELDLSSEMVNGSELFIDEKTNVVKNVVDNETQKELPYKSENLIINSTL